jgi:hypothetical protein
LTGWLAVRLEFPSRADLLALGARRHDYTTRGLANFAFRGFLCKRIALTVVFFYEYNYEHNYEYNYEYNNVILFV